MNSFIKQTVELEDGQIAEFHGCMPLEYHIGDVIEVVKYVDNKPVIFEGKLKRVLSYKDYGYV